MQNQSSSARPSFRNPQPFNTFQRTPYPVADARSFAHSAPTEEAWTPFDGLGPPQQGGRGGGNRNGGGRGGNNPGWRQPNHGHVGRGGGGFGGGRGGPQKRNNNDRQPQKRARKDNVIGGGFEPGHEVIDDEYLMRTFPKFNPADYPQAPPTLTYNPKGFLWDLPGVTATSSFAAHRNGWFRCTIIITLNGVEQVSAVGEANGKKNAEKTACKHAILKLHQAGALKMLMDGGRHALASSKELLNEEQSAVVDIYDYCARFDTVPRINARETPIGRKKLVEVTVSMPEHGIKAIARAGERRHAEILACVEFKRQAEVWHAKHGDEDIVVKDISSSLTTKNAKQFFEYYKIYVDRGINYKVETRALGGSRLKNSMQEGQAWINNEPIGEPAIISGKKPMAEAVAYLTGALALKKQMPEIFPAFVKALKAGNGEILKPISPIWLRVPPEQIDGMQNTLGEIRQIGLPPSEEEIQAEEEQEEGRNRARHPIRRTLDPALAQIKSKKMLAAYEEYQTSPENEKIRKQRQELPMNQYTEQVLAQVENNGFSIIVGATGSGKTTQVPQILLENYTKEGRGADCNIICTQPRRIAATSVAARVAAERNEPLQKSIGYQVRFDAKLPLPGGSVTYCTTGILLQQLRNNPEDALDGITHLVIDEVHERDIMIDYLMIVLKRVCHDRVMAGKPELKVVLMSATMDTELFAKYFRTKDIEGNTIECPHLSVPGRTFPVKEFFLEDIQAQFNEIYRPQELNLLSKDPDTRDYLRIEQEFNAASRTASRAVSPKEDDMDVDDAEADATINWKQEVTISSSGETSISSEKDDAVVPVGLAATTIAHIAKTTQDGAILVFLPGLDEITKLEEMIMTERPLGVDFSDKARFRLYLLHSSIPNQNEVFEEVPAGCRKVILSTNIAETSITIPDVQYVVDTGKHREKQYEQARRITALVCTWVSKSNSKQRAGRAGRVQNGNYFALFSRQRYDSMRATGLPEMLRSDLQEICLDIKLQGFKDNVGKFLSEAIEPPAPHAIEASLTQLRMLGALTDTERMTPLGRALATIPVEPALGKMIILAVIFRCVDPIIILGAAAGGRDIFVSPPLRRKEAQAARNRFVEGSQSDHYAVINAYRQWRQIREMNGQVAAMRFTEDNFLHRGALKVLDQTARQIEGILSDIGILPRRARMDRSIEFGDREHNVNSNCIALVKALTLAGMYPNLAINTGGRGFRTAGEAFTMIHPSSSHYTSGRDDHQFPLGTIMSFSSKARSNDGSSILLRQNTVGTALSALLFGGRFQADGNRLQLDEWIPYVAQGNVGYVVREFRRCLDRLLANAFRSLYHRNQGQYLADDPAREAMARGLVDVLEIDSPQRSGFDSGRDSGRNSPRLSEAGDRYRPGQNYSSSRPSFFDRPSGTDSFRGQVRDSYRPGSDTSSRPQSRNGDRPPFTISRDISRNNTPFGNRPELNSRWR